MSCNKTPVAVLHELCIRNGIVEQYNLVATSGSPNNPLFEMAVEADGLLAHGTGKTKKEAKHNAAQAALQQMSVPAIMPAVQTSDAQKSHSMVNPHSNRGLTGNAVGRLQEYCAINGLPLPVYIITGDEGEPHNRTFSMKCEVSQRYETGVGRTKQVAKHNAAQAMYETLTNNPTLGKLTPSESTPLHIPQNMQLSQAERDHVAETYALCRSLSNITLTSPGLKFNEYHVAMRNVLSRVKEDLVPESFPSPVVTLEAVAGKLGLNVSFHDAIDISGYASGEFFVYAVVNTQPVTVQIGGGQTGGAAIEEAALTVLNYWKIFAGFS